MRATLCVQDQAQPMLPLQEDSFVSASADMILAIGDCRQWS
jgi:hypothetical protein